MTMPSDIGRKRPGRRLGGREQNMELEERKEVSKRTSTAERRVDLGFIRQMYWGWGWGWG